MNDRAILPSSPNATEALWWGWIVPPSWWLAQFEVRYAAVPWACQHGQRWLVLTIGLLALAGSSALVLQVWRLGRPAARAEPLTFLQIGGKWTAIFFALLVAAQMLPDLFLDPCRQ